MLFFDTNEPVFYNWTIKALLKQGVKIETIPFPVVISTGIFMAFSMIWKTPTLRLICSSEVLSFPILKALLRHRFGKTFRRINYILENNLRQIELASSPTKKHFKTESTQLQPCLKWINHIPVPKTITISQDFNNTCFNFTCYRPPVSPRQVQSFGPGGGELCLKLFCPEVSGKSKTSSWCCSRSPRFVVVVVVKSYKLLSLKELPLKVFFFECDFILLHR